MDKLKSFGSKMKLPSTPGGKLSKAFKFDRKHNVLSKPNDPFMDGPMLEDVRLALKDVNNKSWLMFLAIITETTSLHPLRMCMSSPYYCLYVS
jgi:hypothetical protein